MKYFAKLNGLEREVELVERLGVLTVRVDGEVVETSFEEVDGLGQIALYVDGRAYGISIEGDRNDVKVTVAGRVYDIEIEDERERIARAVEKKRGVSGDVKSVMPGVVVALMVKEGDAVTAEQPLLILEAMKMQNEILAPVDGLVKSIQVAEGQAVPGGQLLVSLEVATPDE
ncbi:MAG: biotin/lipoyl-containing protein [Planctomycetota bacterium]